MQRIKKLTILLGSLFLASQTAPAESWNFENLRKKGIDNSFLCYEDRKFITDKTSPQYEYLKNSKSMNYGIISKNGKYVVAVAQRYGKIGDEIEIIFNNNVKIKALIGDYKKTRETLGWGIHPIGKNRGCMLEFLVDTTKIPEVVKKTGDFSSYIKHYAGGIKTITNLRK